MELSKTDNGYRLLIKDDATPKQYEVVLNYLIKKLQLNEVKEVNDFDSYYHLFTYKGNNIVLSYSNFFGISVYFFDENIKADIQEKTLKELSEFLSEVQLNN
jgi:MoaA/NifB/PqqE/SkfB family radical SAM enzyme